MLLPCSECSKIRETEKAGCVMCDNIEDVLDDDTLFTYITQGYNRAEISRMLDLPETAVRYRVQKLRAKYDASNDAELVYRVIDSQKCYHCKNQGTPGL